MEEDVVVIDLKLVCYKLFKQYKKICIIGLIIGLLCGFIKFGIDTYNVKNNTDKYNEALEDYETKLRIHNNTGIVLNEKLVRLTNDLQIQQDYNNNSILMKINPYLEYVSSFDIDITVNNTFENEVLVDNTQKVNQLYLNYIKSGEVIENIIANTNTSENATNINDLISVGYDRQNNIISVSVKGRSEEEVSAITNVIKNSIENNYKDVNSSYKHTYTLLNESVKCISDNSLKKFQDDNKTSISTINDSIVETKTSLDNWKKEANTVFCYSDSGIFSSFIKYLLIGFVCAVFVACGAYALKMIQTSRITGKQYIEQKNLCYIANIYTDDRKIDNIDKLFGITNNNGNQYELLSNNIVSMFDNKKTNKVAFIGTNSLDVVKNMVDQMNIYNNSFEYIGNILEEADSIKKLNKYENVVIVLEDEITRKVQLNEQLQMLNNWKKNIVGVVVLNPKNID